MCSRFREGFVLGFLMILIGAAPTTQPRRVLRIAADPNNLPFSNERLEGFENKLAALIARDLDADIEYTWHAQRRSFFRETMKEGNCDVVLGVPSALDRVLTTSPYYRSTYAFVFRKERGDLATLKSLDDPRLKTLKIGVQLIGNDGANSPPVHALQRRGIVNNLVGFTVYGDYAQDNPPARIIEAVARGDVDVAIAWGPLAGYFASQQDPALVVAPINEQLDPPDLAIAFDISVGVRRSNPALRDEIEKILSDRKSEILQILNDYHVLRVARDSQSNQR